MSNFKSTTTSKPKVALGQPIHEAIPAEAAVSQSLAFLTGVKRGLIYNIFQSYNNFLADARNKICVQALETGGTHVLFLDTDMVVPPDILHELLKCSMPVVGGLYFARLAPYKPVMFRRTPEGPEYMQCVEKWDVKEPMERVDYLGMGATLIQTEVLARMNDRYKDTRFFQFQDGHGEDIWFCNRLKEMGVPCYVNTSIRLGHCSKYVVTADHYIQSLKNPDHPHWQDPTYHFQSITGDAVVKKFNG